MCIYQLLQCTTSKLHLHSVVQTTLFFSSKEWIAVKIHRECMKWMKKIELHLESKAS